MSTRSHTAAETSGIVPHPTDSSPIKRDAGLSMLLFSEDEAVDDYLSNLASELMILFDKPNTIFKATDVDPVEALGQAMEVLDGAEDTLAGLEKRANKHVTFLQVLPQAIYKVSQICKSQNHASSLVDQVISHVATACASHQGRPAIRLRRQTMLDCSGSFACALYDLSILHLYALLAASHKLQCSSLGHSRSPMSLTGLSESARGTMIQHSRSAAPRLTPAPTSCLSRSDHVAHMMFVQSPLWTCSEVLIMASEAHHTPHPTSCTHPQPLPASCHSTPTLHHAVSPSSFYCYGSLYWHTSARADAVIRPELYLVPLTEIGDSRNASCPTVSVA